MEDHCHVTEETRIHQGKWGGSIPKVGVFLFDGDATVLHLDWGEDGLMSSGTSNFVEDACHRALV